MLVVNLVFGPFSSCFSPIRRERLFAKALPDKQWPACQGRHMGAWSLVVHFCRCSGPWWGFVRPYSRLQPSDALM